MATIADLAVLVRSKNAGPFWLTIDIMFDNEAAYRRVRDSDIVSRTAVARMFGRRTGRGDHGQSRRRDGDQGQFPAVA